MAIFVSSKPDNDQNEFIETTSEIAISGFSEDYFNKFFDEADKWKGFKGMEICFTVTGLAVNKENCIAVVTPVDYTSGMTDKQVRSISTRQKRISEFCSIISDFRYNLSTLLCMEEDNRKLTFPYQFNYAIVPMVRDNSDVVSLEKVVLKNTLNPNQEFKGEIK